MQLIERYEQVVAEGDILEDRQQREIIGHLQRLLDEVAADDKRWLPWLRPRPVKGVYLYGPIGVGKTFLLDLFYQALPEGKKARFHFHHFMQQVDRRLRELQGQEDPLRRIAKDFAKKTRVLCFDEFLVHDVAYAMILSELLQALFREGLILVATSNTRPDDLYLNGLQRQRFLPAIALIKKNCEVLSLGYLRDYRLGREPLLTAYLTPLDQKAAALMQAQFLQIAPEAVADQAILVQNREVPTRMVSASAVWFDFHVICTMPRSQLDYLEIAERYETVFISNVPRLHSEDTMNAILLIHLVDVLYDRGIGLVLSAEVVIEELYLQGEVRHEFARTQSRLQEMQSADYLRRHQRRRVQSF